jgi:pyruvate/2-oxoglutarate/acetoin dehydrogenase E1 component
MSYFDELTRAMSLLAEDERVLFLGQSVRYTGHALYAGLKHLPAGRRIELPVFEDTQLGMSIGLALQGAVPVCLFPRMDFLIIAANQLVNHLDKMEEMSAGQFLPRVIIRTALGSVQPLIPGPQHCQDHTEALRSMLRRVEVVRLERSSDIVPAYRRALAAEGSTILIEIPDRYAEP